MVGPQHRLGLREAQGQTSEIVRAASPRRAGPIAPFHNLRISEDSKRVSATRKKRKKTPSIWCVDRSRSYSVRYGPSHASFETLRATVHSICIRPVTDTGSESERPPAGAAAFRASQCRSESSFIRVAPACATTLIVAGDLAFRKRSRETRAPALACVTYDLSNSGY
jgi:hypothetical protein